jgi:RecQ-mediated genome instability protein 1
MSTSDLAAQISAHLHSKHLTPTSSWLTTFLSAQRADVPIAAVKKTALFRILNSDITTSLQRTPHTTFPADMLNAQLQSRVLRGPIPVQVLEVEDIGHSRWSQIESIEAQERGETTKGREIIRVVPGETDGVPGADMSDVGAAESGGPCKLLLQDAKGVRVYAFEMESVESVEGVGGGMAMGAKMVLRDVLVARGVVMLDGRSCAVLGGKIEDVDRKWKEGRKERLKMGIEGANET